MLFLHVGHFFCAFTAARRQLSQKTCLQHICLSMVRVLQGSWLRARRSPHSSRAYSQLQQCDNTVYIAVSSPAGPTGHGRHGLHANGALRVLCGLLRRRRFFGEHQRNSLVLPLARLQGGWEHHHVMLVWGRGGEVYNCSPCVALRMHGELRHNAFQHKGIALMSNACMRNNRSKRAPASLPFHRWWCCCHLLFVSCSRPELGANGLQSRKWIGGGEHELRASTCHACYRASSCLNVAGRLLLFASVWVASAMPAAPKGQPVVTCTFAQTRALAGR